MINSTHPEESTSTKNISLWCHFDDKSNEVKTKTTTATTSTLSIRQYLKLPHRDSKINPLEFWDKKTR